MHQLYQKHLFIAICIHLFAAGLIAQGNVYPEVPGLKPSEEYEVYVNGIKAFVYNSPIPAAFCSFEIVGPVEIVIKTKRDLKWVDVRPLSAGISPFFKDSTIRFRLERPAQLSIELNGSIKLPLFLFANSPERNKPLASDKNVKYFEAGKIHYPGIIEIKSGQTVYIEAGAVVVGVIKSKDAKNIRIAGRGILDGSYNRMFNDAVIKTGDSSRINANQSGQYERFIELDHCADVTIEGITLFNGTSWQVVPVNCKRVSVENIKIISDNPSDDGIDVVHSQDVTIAKSFIRTKDDCVVLKAYMERSFHISDSVSVGTQPLDVQNVEVKDCVFWNALWGNALEIGFELNGVNVKNIRFANSDVIHVEAGAVFSIHNAGTSVVSDIVFENIRVEDARQKLFDLAIFRSQYSRDGTQDPEERKRLYLNGAWDGVLLVPQDKKDYHAQFRGQIRKVLFKNISVVDGLFPYSVFYGFDENHLVSDVRIEKLFVGPVRIKNMNKAKVYLGNTEKIVIR